VLSGCFEPSSTAVARGSDAIPFQNGPNRKLVEGTPDDNGPMLFLFALAAATASQPPVTVHRRARASVTILNGFRGSSGTWEPAARRNQREVVRKESTGHTIRLRLTEFE